MDSKGCPHPRAAAVMRTGFVEADEERASPGRTPTGLAVIVPFPRSPNARMRHLAQTIFGYLEDHCPNAFIADSDINCLVPFLDTRCDSFDLDDYATLNVLPSSGDYRLTMKLRDGVQTLLVTDDAEMMAEFACQYLLARFNWPNVVDRCL